MTNKTFQILKNSRGFTLTEVLLAAGFMGLLSVLMGTSMVAMNNTQLSAQSQADLQAIFGRLQKAIKTKNINATTCKNILSLQSTPDFSTNGKTEVEIKIPGGETLKKDTAVAGSNNLHISSLYLTNNVLVASSPTENMYVSDLVIEFNTEKNFGFMTKRRSLATFSVSMESGAMKSCNTNYMLQGNKDFCDGLDGMTWSDAMNACVQAAKMDNVTNEFESCSPGTWKKEIPGQTGATCVPVANDCGNGKIAKGYKDGIVSGCATPSTGIVAGTAPVTAPPMPPPPVLPQTPVSNPAPIVTANPYTAPPAPAVIQNIPPPTAPQDPDSSCSSAYYIDPYIIAMCTYYGFPCDLTGLAAAAANCTAQANQGYVTPNLVAVPPSPSPPPDNTCMCNGARINSGEYCMYCVNEIGVGYGIIDDYNTNSYGVKICSAGVLVDEPGALLDTGSGPFCSNTWVKGKKTAGKFTEW